MYYRITSSYLYSIWISHMVVAFWLLMVYRDMINCCACAVWFVHYWICIVFHNLFWWRLVYWSWWCCCWLDILLWHLIDGWFCVLGVLLLRCLLPLHIGWFFQTGLYVAEYGLFACWEIALNASTCSLSTSLNVGRVGQLRELCSCNSPMQISRIYSEAFAASDLLVSKPSTFKWG